MHWKGNAKGSVRLPSTFNGGSVFASLTATRFAKALGVSRQTVNELLRERRAVSPSMALCLSRLFGTTPEFWLNAQRDVDLWDATKSIKKKIERITPLNAA